MMFGVSNLGRRALRFFSETGRVCSFSLASMGMTLKQKAGLRQSLTQTSLLTSRCAIPVIMVTGPIGAMLAMQALVMSSMFGVDRLLPPLVASTIIRELAPGFAAVMVCFQAGAGIAAELGTMRVREEIDAIVVMGLDARGLVVGPRIIGACFACALLNIIAIVAAMIGAYVVSVPMSGLSHTLFVEGSLEGIAIGDIVLSEIKSLIFGLLLGGVSATFGYFTKGGARGVGLSANRAVVATVILVLFGNYIINTILLGFAKAF